MSESRTTPWRIRLAGLAGLAVVTAACGPVGITGLAASSGGGGGSDNVDPDTFLSSAPGEYENHDAATFQLSSNEAGSGFEGRLDYTGTDPEEAWLPVASPYTTPGVLSEGEHVFECRAVDPAGNRDAIPVEHEWTVDRTEPTRPQLLTARSLETTLLELTWTSATDDRSGLQEYRIHYESDPPGQADQPPGSPVSTFASSVVLTGVTPCEDYVLWVTAVDRAGNESPRAFEQELRTWCGWDGTFSELLLPVGVGPEALVSGHFDDDGVTDLAVLNRVSQDVTVVLGDRDGLLQPLAPFQVGVEPINLLTDDFDSDGREDLLVLYATGGGTNFGLLLPGTCGPGFGDPVAGYVGNDVTTAAATADWSGDSTSSLEADGRPDLLFGRTASRGCTESGVCGGCSNDGLFETICSFDGSSGSGLVVACATGDFDADGRTDAVVLTDTGLVEVSLFGSDGGGPNACYGYCFSPLFLAVAGAGSCCLVTSDFDADGDLDLAVGRSSSNTIGILLGNGNGSFSTPVEVQVGAPTRSLVLADFDGDGIDDLVAATPEGFAVVPANGANGKGDGTFSDPIVGVCSLGSDVRSIATGDFNADDITDLALSVQNPDAVCVLLGGGATRQGNGRFASSELALTRPAVDVATADFDLDGILDLAVGSGDGVTDVYLGEGRERQADGTYRYAGSLVFANSFDCDVLPCFEEEGFDWATGDFDGNGIPDLLVAGERKNNLQLADKGQLEVLLGGGQGGFVSQPNPAGVWLSDLLVADLDGDGLSDLVAIDQEELSVFLRLGDELTPLRVSPGSSLTGPGGLSSLAVADFDGDGRLDIAAGGDVEVLIGLQADDGSFGPGPTLSLPPGLEAGSMVAQDLDGDGIFDLAVVGASPLHVFPGQGVDCQGDATFGAATTFADAHALERLTPGDFDGDGITDLVATEAGAVLLLLGTGSDGRGDGGFADPTPLAAGAHRIVTTGDLDTDGSADLALTDDALSRLSLLFGGAPGP